MSPAYINILLHIYYRSEPVPNSDAPVTRDALESFVKECLIKNDGDEKSGFKILPRGEATVDMLCATPLAESIFIDPRTDERL